MKNQNEINEILREIIKRLDLIKENNQKTVLGRFLKHDVISEGLIMTHSRKSVITMLNNIGAKKYHIGLGKAYGSFSNKDGEKPNTLYLSFNDGIQTMGREYFNKLIGYMYMLGWYIANKDIPKDCYDILKNYRSFTLLFEAKFDVELDLDEVNDNFYHITKKSLIDKITRNGLTPKNGCMVTFHPNRVYLFVGKPNNWKSIAENFRSMKDVDDKFVLLKIDRNQINKSNKLFIDPNSKNYKACYTYEPIPPFAIYIDDEE